MSVWVEVKGEEARDWVSKRTYGPAAVDSREQEKRKMYQLHMYLS